MWSHGFSSQFFKANWTSGTRARPGHVTNHVAAWCENPEKKKQPGTPSVLFFYATLPLKPATIALKIGHLAFQEQHKKAPNDRKPMIPQHLRAPQVGPIFLIRPEKSWNQNPGRLKVSSQASGETTFARNPIGEEGTTFCGRIIRVHRFINIKRYFLSSIKYTKQTKKRLDSSYRPVTSTSMSIYIYVYIDIKVTVCVRSLRCGLRLSILSQY